MGISLDKSVLDKRENIFCNYLRAKLKKKMKKADTIFKWNVFLSWKLKVTERLMCSVSVTLILGRGDVITNFVFVNLGLLIATLLVPYFLG